MRPPKHIRDAKRQLKLAALQSYQEAKASGTLERSTYSSYGAKHGYALSPDANLGYRFHQPMNAKGSSNKKGYDSITKTINYRDSNGETKQFKYRTQGKTSLSNSELYSDNKPVPQRGECKVRIGTTPSRGIMMVDKETGEEKYVKLKAKPKYQDVGLVSCVPKDGGK